jgi:hypothetical protein
MPPLDRHMPDRLCQTLLFVHTHRQLVTAIRMYFTDDDMVAVHTIACAAREIYEKYCDRQGIDRMFEYIRAANTEYDRKQLSEILNRRQPSPNRMRRFLRMRCRSRSRLF